MSAKSKRQDVVRPAERQDDTSVMRHVSHQKVSVTYARPLLPSAEELKGYAEVLPDAPDRIMRMTERTLTHQRRMNWGNLVSQFVGQASALLVALSVLYASYLLVASGHDVAGTILGGVDLAALVSVFLGARWVGSRQ